MRALLIIPCIAFLLQTAPQSRTFGTVQGTVVRAGSVDPLPGVEIALGQLTDVPTSSDRTVVSDSAGRFLFKDVPAGLYSIAAQREGFSSSTANAFSLTVTDGETSEIRFSMVAGGIIRGRVLDSTGQFLPNATVTAYSRVFFDGIASLQAVFSRTTDDRGEYRLFDIPPGDYYVSATPRASVARSAPGTVRDAPTFFPSAASVSTATPVNVTAGAESRGIDVILTSRLQARISGRVVSDLKPSLQDSMATIHLVPRDLSVPIAPFLKETSVLLKPSAAEFEIPDVETGAYELFAIIDGNVGRFPVNVIDKDVAGVIVIVQSGVTLRGEVTVEGKADIGSAAEIRIEPVDALIRTPDGSRPIVITDIRGPFILDNMPAARFRVSAALPTDLYIEDVLLGGRSVYDSGFDIHAGSSPDPLQVIVKSGAGTVEGTVRDNAGTGLAGATVALVPETRRSNPALYRSVTADGAGTFVLHGITPGAYRIFAWQRGAAGAFYDPEFVSRFGEYGVAIDVVPGSTSRANIAVSQKESR